MDEEGVRRIFRELHYQEGVDSKQGFVPESEIHEFTAEQSSGGFVTYQQLKKFHLGCGHVDRFRDHCGCNKTCCDKCLCQICQRGTCRDCRIQTPDSILLCLACHKMVQEIQLQESEKTTWLNILKILGIITE